MDDISWNEFWGYFSDWNPFHKSCIEMVFLQYESKYDTSCCNVSKIFCHKMDIQIFHLPISKDMVSGICKIRNFYTFESRNAALYYYMSKSIKMFFQMNSSKMSVHATTLIKGFSTRFANVRFFSSVLQNVNFHVWIVWIHFGTKWTSVWSIIQFQWSNNLKF